jgi:hypothetical protein
MISEDKQEKLREYINTWCEGEGLPETVQNMLFQMGVENPQTDEEKDAICKRNLWSESLIQYYDEFVNYLVNQRNSAKTTKTAEGGPDLLLSLKTLRQLLDQIIEQVENGN